jgi:centractin
MAGGLENEIFLGSMADEYRGLLNIKYPMENGIVNDWHDMEKLWQHIYSKNQLNSNAEEVMRLEFYFCLSKSG